MAKHRVVIVGGGFGGLQAALHLKGADVDVTVVDRRNFHLFQPLAYQVATGALGTGEVAYPLRSIFRGQDNVRVMLAEAERFDLDAKTVHLRTAEGVTIKSDEGEQKVRAATVIWAAGVLAASVATKLAEAAGAEQDSVDRLLVEPDLTLPGYPDVLAIGDMVQIKGGDPLPGVAPVAMQMGRYVARSVKSKLRGGTSGPFKYKDKGNLATLGRARAIAELPPGIKVSGFFAWALWLGIHLWYLVGFQNRVLVFTRWGFSFLTHGRGTRLITGEQHMP